MNITLTNRQIFDAKSALSTLLDSPLPIKIAFAVSKNAKAVNAALQSFDELRNKILIDNAEKDAEGKHLTEADGRVKIKDMQKLNEDMAELMACTNYVDIVLIKVADIESAGITIKPSALLGADFIFEV